MSKARKHAIELGAVSLGALLTTAGFTTVLAQLTAAQIGQLQRYLDAAVIDPAVQNEANALYRKGTKVYGQIVYTDPETKRRVDRVMREYIPLHQLDDTVRLDLSKVLDSKALAPITDNPDEAEYLESVHNSLGGQGVWLRIAPKRVNDPDDRSRWIYDGKHFEVWLSLARVATQFLPRPGELIARRCSRPRSSARITGAKSMRDRSRARSTGRCRVGSQMEDGMALHADIAEIRREAAIGVVEVSDLLGRADFPNYDIWDGPNTLVVSAMKMRNAGFTWGAGLLLIVAAITVRNAANLLNTYIAKTTTGAARSVKVLKVARTAGKVAEVGLAITTGAAFVTGGGAASGVAAANSVVDAAAEKELGKYLARNPDLAGELNSVKLVPGPRGTVLGNIKGGHSAGFREIYKL